MDIFITLYHNTYNKQLILCYKFIKRILIDHALEYHDEYFATNDILKKISDVNNHLIKKNEPYQDLFRNFDNRLDFFSDAHQYMVIPKKLQPSYLEINNSIEDYKEFIIDLAKFNAYREASRLFANNSTIYHQIYLKNRFDLITTDTYLPLKNHSELYKQLFNGTVVEKPIGECITENDFKESEEFYLINNINLKTNIIQPEKPTTFSKINFRVKVHYKETFLNCYDFFTLHFIDKDKVSKECFNKIFLEDSNSHDCVLKFTCDNPIAAYLLFKIGKIFFIDLTYAKIEKSKKFISRGDTTLSQPTLSRSKKTIKFEDQDLIDNFFKNVLLSVKKC